MIKCELCHRELDDSKNDTKNSFIIKDNKYYCIPCEESLSFMEDLNKDDKREKKIKIIKKKPESKMNCNNCNNSYSGNNCPKCNTINPLLIIKKKKTKKKKK